jgi:CRISPR-associated protein Csc2
VINNILRTRHYGAQTTRTGRLRNELIGMIFADGEIVSNLRWTQKIYDLMTVQNQINPPDPLQETDVIEAAKTAITNLMTEESLVHTDLIDESFEPLLTEVKALISSENGIISILQNADQQAKAYYDKYIKKVKTK